MSFLPDYLGYPIWLLDDFAPKDELRFGFQNYTVVNGETYGPKERHSHGVGNRIFNHKFLIKSLADQWEIEEHHGAMRGMNGLFWIPSYYGMFELSADANISDAIIEIIDRLEVFGLKGVKRHVFDPASQTPYEIANPVNASAEGALEVDIAPVISSSMKEGGLLWGLHLVRFGNDALSIGAAPDGIVNNGGDIYEIKETNVTFLESQGNTPTGF